MAWHSSYFEHVIRYRTWARSTRRVRLLPLCEGEGVLDQAHRRGQPFLAQP